MKNKLMKILGLALTLAVLIGLLVPAIPASAGTMSWTNTDMPTNITQDTDFDLIAFAPDGKTVFAWDGISLELIKSTDAGKTWLPPGKVGEGLNDADVMAIAVSPRYATDSVVVAATQTGFYYSEDGGKKFVTDQIELPDGFGGDINWLALAISYNWDDKMAIAIGYDGGVLISVGSAFKQAAITDNVIAVAFAPDYSDSDMVLALVDNETVGTTLQGAGVSGKATIDTAAWTIKATFLDNAVTPGPVVAPYEGYMAFPSDYSSDDNAIVFVGLCTLDAYRADLNAEDNVATNLRLDKKYIAAADNYWYGVAYTGTASSGTLAVGLDTQIWTSANADTVDGAATWAKPKKLATGVNFKVAFVGDTLYAASSNNVNYNFGSAFFVSPDYTYFNGISRISVDDTDHEGLTFDQKSGIGESTQYVMVNSLTTPVSILMKTTDSGKTWTEIFADADTEVGVELNNVSIVGDTVYLASDGDVLRISSDGGNTFKPTTLRHDMQAFSAIIPGTYYYATDGQDIYKNGDRIPVTLDTNDFIIVLIPIPGFFVVNTLDFSQGLPPLPGHIFFSGDMGATFKQLGDLTPVCFTFDVPGRTFYAVDDTNTLWSYNVDTSTAWTKGKEINVAAQVIKIALSNDAAMYAQVDVGDAEDAYQLYRSVDINAPFSFEPIPGSMAEDVDPLVGTFSTAPGPLDVVSGADGNTIYRVTALGDDVAPGKGLSVKMKQFTDTMVTAPTGVAPVADAQVPSQPMFQWTAVVGGQNRVEYEIEVTTTLDARGGFVGDVKSINNDGDTTTALSTSGITLVPGETYYWHVRATATAAAGKALTLSSKWSTTTKFVVKLTQVNPDGTTWIAPAAGATGVSQTPNFQWASVPRATGYELVIDGGAPIALTDPVYTLTTPLAYGSTHTWKVRAISGSTASDWVSGVFTVMAAPVTSTTTTAPKFFDPNSGQYFDSQAQLDAFQAAWKTNHPAPVAPSTPAYVWVIIVIAAILVIAVIVLIARTRRV